MREPARLADMLSLAVQFGLLREEGQPEGDVRIDDDLRLDFFAVSKSRAAQT